MNEKHLEAKKRKTVKKALSSGQASIAPDPAAPKINAEKVPKQAAEKQAVSPKSKQQKSNRTLAEQPSANKPQIKNKKSEKNERNALKKKAEKVGEEKEKAKKEEAGEWVQLLTRKEKKNRKRDELFGIGDDEDLKNEGSKGGTPEKKQPTIIGGLDSKESSPSKKKNKKKTNKDSEEKNETQLEENVELENAKNEIILKEKVEKERVFEKKIVEELKCFDDFAVESTRDEETEFAPKTKSAPAVQVKAQDSVTEASPKTKNSKKNRAKAVVDVVANADQIAQNKVSPTAETPKCDSASKDVKVAAEELGESAKSQSEVSASNAGGVAFDELKDVWQEPKTQKKKKKARKDQ